MGFIEDELSEVRKLCEGVVNGSKLVSCVQTMVRVEIKRTIYKCLVVCIQFPSDYPAAPLLIELKSKYLSEKLLFGKSVIVGIIHSSRFPKCSRLNNMALQEDPGIKREKIH